MTAIERYDAAMTLVQTIETAARQAPFSIADVQGFAKDIVALTGRKRGEPKKPRRVKADKGNGDA